MTMGADLGSDPHLTPGARRILEVASELFYRRGIHAIGVDTIAAASGVTKRTLYNRFGSKEALVTAYLAARDRRWRGQVLAYLDAAGQDPSTRVMAPFDALQQWLTPDSRGCGFVNAFAELPDTDHPAHQLVVAGKIWLRDLFRSLLLDADTTADTTADTDGLDTLAGQLLSLHEGAVVSYSILGDTSAASSARGAAQVLLDQVGLGRSPSTVGATRRCPDDGSADM